MMLFYYCESEFVGIPDIFLYVIERLKRLYPIDVVLYLMVESLHVSIFYLEQRSLLRGILRGCGRGIVVDEDMTAVGAFVVVNVFVVACEKRVPSA